MAIGNQVTRLAEAIRIADASRFTRLLDYQPYPKQRAFHAMGRAKRERLLMAGNQNGKSFCGGAEMAYHLTGLYPDWWTGLRFDHEIVAWAGAITNEDARDVVQAILFGREGEFGTGLIPADRIEDYTWARGIGNLIDTAQIRHVCGRNSLLSFKSYAQGRKRWQGAPVHFVWFDEEPEGEEGAKIYSEGVTRTTATGGSTIMTFTPLLGMTQVVCNFFPEPNAPQRGLVQMDISDAEHIPEWRREQEIAKYPAHEREARARGIPMLGSGRVFPIAESEIVEDPRELPRWWPRIAGMDFGWDHPNAVAWLAWDRDADTIHVYAEHRESEQVVALHADAIRTRGAWIPVAWPHDGLVHDRTSGMQLAQQYAQKGVRMLPEHAQFQNGSNGLEAGIQEMLDRMKSGRWKVSTECKLWLEEFRMYHRKEGKIVKLRDDLLSASRYGLMCLRYARTEEIFRIVPSHREYDPLEALN
jgi:phage terminase large subunit-like protein